MLESQPSAIWLVPLAAIYMDRPARQRVVMSSKIAEDGRARKISTRNETWLMRHELARPSGSSMYTGANQQQQFLDWGGK